MMAEQDKRGLGGDYEPADVADAAAEGRGAHEAGSIEEAVSADREEVREDLSVTAAAVQAASSAADREIGFGRQMVQLALIPALIVGSVMGVWLIIISLAGRSQDMAVILQNLEKVPRYEGDDDAGVADAVVGRPGRQQAFRDAMTLAAQLGADDLTAEERVDVRQRLEVLARRHMGADAEFLSFLMKSLGMLHDVESLGLFEEMLASGDGDDQYAAVLGLYSWQEAGDLAAARELSGAVVGLLESDNLRIRTVAAVVLAGLASRDDMVARDGLARVMEVTTIENREAVWNAGCALAALGDARGLPVVLSLLDREWLERQPDIEEGVGEGVLLSVAAQDKLILTVLNVLVRYERGEGEVEGRFVVQVEDEVIWVVVEGLAEGDPSEMVRSVAGQVLAVWNER